MVSVDKSDKANLRAKLASVDAFKSAGIDYPYNIPKLKFQIENRASGEPYLKVTSTQPVNEPFVTLLIELSWSSGKLLREYTFLLDPPDYKPEQAKVEEVKPIEPVLATPVVVPPLPEPAVAEPAVAEPATAEPIAAEPAAVEAAPVAAEMAAPTAESAVAATAEPAAAEQPAAEQPMTEQPLVQEQAPAEAAPSVDPLSKEEAIAEAAPVPVSEAISVKRGDSLSKIAAKIKPADVSLERMLVALYRENAKAFDGHNMNRLRAGKILNMPSSEAISMLPQADAEEEVRAQAADWNVYRQKLAAAKVAAEENADKQEAAGKISTAVTDKAASDKEPAKEVLKLSKGEAPSDKAVGSGKTTAQEKAIAKEEESIAKNKALKEAQERTALLEKNIKDMQRLAELKKESAASAPAAAVAMNAASAAQAASSVAEAKPKPKAKVVPAPVVEQPSLIDQLLGDPLYMAGGAALLLVLGGAGFVVARRGKQGGAKPKSKKEEPKQKVEEDVGGATGRIAAPVVPSPDTGDFTSQPAVTAAPESNAAAEEVDPLGEADLFLTFGRDAQAEEVLKEALHKNPNNLPVKLKLLSIYANRKDTNSFYSYAREIKESGDESAWEQTAAMGRELEPSNPFYGGSGAASAAAEVASAPEAAAPAVDFDLGFGTAEPAAAEFASQNTVVLEAPSQEKTTIMSSEELRAAAQATPMDFDITGTHPGVEAVAEGKTEEAPSLNMDDLVFDVTATHPKLSATDAAPAPAAVAAAEDGGMAFTLDFPTDFSKPEVAAPKPAVTVPDIGLGDISLNLDGLSTPAPAASAEAKDEAWHEVATKLDLAKAYQEMGDAAGAREILDEVMRDGDEQQRETAQALLQQL
ncbi:MAG TPA: FimV/HubP family polar landmark protein [Sideroxyarcus sp.]|nr:FimV/HubP family polar landmark protein [Sideroxyarcus sp.]